MDEKLAGLKARLFDRTFRDVTKDASVSDKSEKIEQEGCSSQHLIKHDRHVTSNKDQGAAPSCSDSL